MASQTHHHTTEHAPDSSLSLRHLQTARDIMIAGQGCPIPSMLLSERDESAQPSRRRSLQRSTSLGERIARVIPWRAGQRRGQPQILKPAINVSEPPEAPESAESLTPNPPTQGSPMETIPLSQRLKSRKFLLALFAQITAIIVLMFPSHESDIVTASQSISALLLMTLTAFGYIRAEGKVDEARATSAWQPIAGKVESIKPLQVQDESIKDASETTNQSTKGGGQSINGLLIAFGILSIGLLFGCSSRQQSLDSLEAASTVTINAAIKASEDGIITDDQFAEFYQAYRPVAAAIVAARPLVDTDPETFDQHIESARIGLGLVRALLADFGVILSPVETINKESSLWKQPSSSHLQFCLRPLKTLMTYQQSMPAGSTASRQISVSVCVIATTRRSLGWMSTPGNLA